MRKIAKKMVIENNQNTADIQKATQEYVSFIRAFNVFCISLK